MELSMTTTLSGPETIFPLNVVSLGCFPLKCVTQGGKMQPKFEIKSYNTRKNNMKTNIL